MLFKISEEDSAKIGTKQYYDWLKHLTTLDTGSILLLATFSEKLFPNPEWRFLFVLTLVCLGLSLIAAVSAMLFFLVFLGVTPSKEGENAFLLVNIAAFYGFIIGVISFLVFALKNFL